VTSTRYLSPLALVLVAVTVLAASTAAAARSSGRTASTTVDGTWSCPVPALNGYRAVKVDSARALGIAAAGATIATLLANGFLVGIDAGPIGNAPGHVLVSRSCVRMKTPTSFTRGDLSGPDTLQASYVCDAPKRVLVRVKAVLTSKAVWVKGPSFLAVNRNVKAATLVVKSSSGRPLAYAQLTGKRAQLWSDPIACTRA
jgi:hypothetical protein